MNNTTKIRVGDKVRFINQKAHEDMPSCYPAVGTCGKVLHVIEYAEDDIELDNGPAVSFAAPTKKLTSENYMPKEQSLHELAGDLILPVINLIEQGQSFVVDVTRPDKPSKRPAKNNLLSRILTGGFY